MGTHFVLTGLYLSQIRQLISENLRTLHKVNTSQKRPYVGTICLVTLFLTQRKNKVNIHVPDKLGTWNKLCSWIQ